MWEVESWLWGNKIRLMVYIGGNNWPSRNLINLKARMEACRRNSKIEYHQGKEGRKSRSKRINNKMELSRSKSLLPIPSTLRTRPHVWKPCVVDSSLENRWKIIELITSNKGNSKSRPKAKDRCSSRSSNSPNNNSSNTSNKLWKHSLICKGNWRNARSRFAILTIPMSQCKIFILCSVNVVQWFQHHLIRTCMASIWGQPLLYMPKHLQQGMQLKNIMELN